MKIKIGPYQITGHRPGEPLKEGDSGFALLPVKIENATARAHRANRELSAQRKGKAPEQPAPPLARREVVQTRRGAQTGVEQSGQSRPPREVEPSGQAGPSDPSTLPASRAPAEKAAQSGKAGASGKVGPPEAARPPVKGPTTTKAVTSIRKVTDSLAADSTTQDFVVRHVDAETFSLAPFRAKFGITAQTFDARSLDLADLRNGQPELYHSLGLDNPDNELQFREELATFVLDARELFRDPQAVAEALKPVDDELGKRLGWNADEYAGVDELVIGDNTVMLPNYAKIQPLPEKKGQMLSEVLQERESEHGVNRSKGALGTADVSVFDGFVDPQVSDPYVARGHLFGENENRGNFITHGTHSHRLQWECIRQWVASGRLKAPAAIASSPDGGSPFQKLLAATVYTSVKGSNPRVTLWGKLIDSADDTRRNMEEKVSVFRVDELAKGKSSLAPDGMMSTIKCFGADLGLKHLQKYLNDSAVKRLQKLEVIDRSQATYQMEGRVNTGDAAVFKRMAFLVNADKPPSLNALAFTLPDVGEEQKMYAALPAEKREAAAEFVERQTMKHSERAPTRAPAARPAPSPKSADDKSMKS
jgi:hypothetical protein